jgi:indolepyruvate ferredoxin oxidoreductase alpha subunit
MITNKLFHVNTTGNQAIAWAAIEAGVNYFAHYPGSPVNQVEPALQKICAKENIDIIFNHATNEHIATLAAAGASYCGARSMVVFKHVGMNIASDPLNYLGYTGLKGGMVVIVGTDPGATCSTGEEDPHWYAPQMNLPLFEPTTVQEIKDTIVKAYDISEKYEVPVLVFLPAKLCYNTDKISVQKATPHLKTFHFDKNPERFINVGQKAVRNHRALIERLDLLASETNFVQSFGNPEAPFAIVTRGITLSHVYESMSDLNLSNDIHHINVAMTYPLNLVPVAALLEKKSKIVIIEDQDGFLENQLKMKLFNILKGEVHGKDIFPVWDEVSFHLVDSYLRKEFNREQLPAPLATPAVPERLGAFCEGCPHRSIFYAIDEAIKGTDTIIGGDIGCSSLPPHRTDWLLCMNAGIGISQGMSHILKEQQVISTGGEGSFFHGGILSLQSAVLNKINLLHMVLDNRSVAMTGHQESPTRNPKTDYRGLLESIGVDKIIEVSAFNPLELTLRIRQELKGNGVRVMWVKGDCALQPDPETELRRKTKFIAIDNTQCLDCDICYSDLQCPAIERVDTKSDDLKIDLDKCMRCGVCIEICPNDAITVRYQNESSL